MTEYISYVWTLFKGSVRKWNYYLRYLQNQLDEEKQLTPMDSEGENPFPPLIPHAPFKSYDEATFEYNLDGKLPPLTQSTSQSLAFRFCKIEY